MNIMPTTGSPARGGRVASTTCYTCCKPAAQKSLIYKAYSRFSRFSRFIDNSNTGIGTQGYIGTYKAFPQSPAEPAEPAAVVSSQWVRRSRMVGAQPATCCTTSPSHPRGGALMVGGAAGPFLADCTVDFVRRGRGLVFSWLHGAIEIARCRNPRNHDTISPLPAR
jgi:hypothetical protein